LAKSPDPKAEITALVELAVPEFADCCSLYWIDAEGKPILAVAKGPSDRGTETPWCDGLYCQADLRETLQSELVKVGTFDHGSADQGTSDSGFRYRTVVVPLIADGQILGAIALCFDSIPVDSRFDQEFGEQLAFCARCAFENANGRIAAQDASELMNRHLRTVSHDLATPLAVLSLALQMGLDRLHSGDAVDARILHNAMRQVEHLTGIINKLASEAKSRTDKVGMMMTDAAVSAHRDELRAKV
jgi:signal transduction histidine kinase